MPKRTDIKRVLVIGAGPIVIGQACEFDYSGTQGAKALKQEGYEVVLVNSNPATVMTDPEFADRTYVEPLDPEVVETIIEREKPAHTLYRLVVLDSGLSVGQQARVGIDTVLGGAAAPSVLGETTEDFGIRLRGEPAPRVGHSRLGQNLRL